MPIRPVCHAAARLFAVSCGWRRHCRRDNTISRGRGWRRLVQHPGSWMSPGRALDRFNGPAVAEDTDKEDTSPGRRNDARRLRNRISYYAEHNNIDSGQHLYCVIYARVYQQRFNGKMKSMFSSSSLSSSSSELFHNQICTVKKHQLARRQM